MSSIPQSTSVASHVNDLNEGVRTMPVDSGDREPPW